MQKEIISGKAPGQELKGAPGPAITIPRGLYKIYSSLSFPNWLVDMSLNGGNTRNVKLYRDNNESESTWKILREYEGKYPIENGRSGQLCLDYDSTVKATFALNVYVDTQLWVFKDAGSGFVYIECSNGNVLDVKGSGTADNVDIIPWPYAGTANQKFKLVKIGDV